MFKSRGDIVYKCTVRLLEDTEILECEFHPSYKGKYLLEHVCQQLNLTEIDYFGLRYVDAGGQRHWLHMAKLILKQVKDASPILFSFRVKFYPPNPLLLKEDVTRFQIYLQLKRDLLHGRLYCTANEAAMLGALIIQIELGDYDPSIHVGNYVTEMRLLLRQTDVIEARIQELHREPVAGTPGGTGGVKGMSTQEAERSFLKIACQLDTYGVDPHPVKDHRGNQLYLGINHSGILTFQGSRKTHHFKWSEVHKINFEGRMFIVHLNYPEKKHTVGFKCPSGASCRHVWCCAIEQMLFFTLPSSSEASVYSGGGLFSWGTKFKYVGRTEREILERDGLLAPREPHEEGSSTGGKRKASSVPATPSTPMTSDFGYSSLPRSTHSAPLEESAADCNGGCLLSGPAVDIALACCDHLRPLPEEPKPPAPEYSLRDSFEHSSSESGATHASGGGSGGGGGAAAGAAGGGGGPLPDEWSRLAAPALQPPPRPFSLLRAFVPSFLFVWLSLALAALLLFETDWPPLRALKHKPELVALRRHYYAPLKEYLRRKVVELF
ncbi:FERM domain-containing protein 5 [Galleria mellonella]|uniref:Moesin/ezrin/radixin homolog 1 n=1 Tax=Galleria mellonella TaxID=7137 RepID=A0ABM3N2G0_GALME|nr:FERM domain-containing protein 5 [Galleria mellonella]